MFGVCGKYGVGSMLGIGGYQYSRQQNILSQDIVSKCSVPLHFVY